MKRLCLSTSFLLCVLLTAVVPPAGATEDTIRTGSYIINMGVMPQTIANGLKPYGLVYSLLKNHKVPVKWVIRDTKIRNGIDFTHNGIHYRGGTFIVPFEFRTIVVNAEISAWEAQGVTGNTSVSDMVLDVTRTLHYAPNWTMDKANGTIVVNYFSNAGIPDSAYGGSSSNWKNPDQLNACDDIFVLPHADPTWAIHNNLHAWNRDFKGNLWVACHAVSELENLVDSVTGTQLNFLTTGGLIPWNSHKFDGSPPYVYQDDGHPVMQFMANMDHATNNGSERTFLPKTGSSWRSTTMLGVYDTTNVNIPALSPGPAAIVAYGHAYGDSSRGWVMYQAGHNHTSSGFEWQQVAAQRAFFNYSFFVATDRYATLNPTISGLPEVLTGNQPYNLSFAPPPGIDPGNYTIQWSSSCGGTFSPDSNSQSVTFTPPVSGGACIVTVALTDGCGREIFSSEGTYITSVLPRGVTLQGRYDHANSSAHLKWTGPDNHLVSHYEIQRAYGNNSFNSLAIVFADENFSKADYTYTDAHPGGGEFKYRMLVHKLSGAVSYSNTIRLGANLNEVPQIEVLSNPSRGTVAFTCQLPEQGPLTATLADMSGRILSRKTVIVQKGPQLVQMGNLGKYAAGTYVLQVITGGQTIVRKIRLVR